MFLACMQLLTQPHKQLARLFHPGAEEVQTDLWPVFCVRWLGAEFTITGGPAGGISYSFLAFLAA